MERFRITHRVTMTFTKLGAHCPRVSALSLKVSSSVRTTVTTNDAVIHVNATVFNTHSCSGGWKVGKAP